MTETYNLSKDIPALEIDIDITVGDRELLLKLDDLLIKTIAEHYNLQKGVLK